MKSFCTLILLLAVSLKSAYSDKILVLSFMSSKSHKITYMPLIEELASRGHQITIVTPIKSEKDFTNIKEIFTLENATPCTMKKHMDGNSLNVFQMKEAGRTMNPFLMLEQFGDICRSTYDLPQVKGLLKEKFDLVFMQPIFNECALGLVYRLQAPLVLFSPVSVPSILVNKLGGYFPPSFVGNVFLGYSDDMTFLERLVNFGMDVLLEGMLKFYYEPYITSVYREKVGEDVPTIPIILKNASLLLSNGHFSISRPKPFMSDMVEIGGLHSRPAQALPKELAEFVASSQQEGFILFSMGSAYQGDMMSDKKRSLFLNVFSKLKQTVIWKWESEKMENLPKNVLLKKWLPQLDLLGHESIKMFITHCGAGSLEEAIYHGVPLIGIPLFGDQGTNAKQGEDQGILYRLDWNTMTEEGLMRAIQQILSNSKYQEKAAKLSKIFKDQPDDPLKRGVWWIEYVLRHKGAPQLRSASRNLNFIQYHSLDIIFVYCGIIFTVFYLLLTVVRKLGRKCVRWNKVHKNDFERMKKNQ